MRHPAPLFAGHFASAGSPADVRERFTLRRLLESPAHTSLLRAESLNRLNVTKIQAQATIHSGSFNHLDTYCRINSNIDTSKDCKQSSVGPVQF